jgi:hypothetical protein
MTITRFAVAGAVLLNVPTLAAASALPALSIVVSALVLAVLGAALGAVTGLAILRHDEGAAAAVSPASRDAERIAA